MSSAACTINDVVARACSAWLLQAARTEQTTLLAYCAGFPPNPKMLNAPSTSNARGRLFGRAADAPSFKYRPLAAISGVREQLLSAAGEDAPRSPPQPTRSPCPFQPPAPPPPPETAGKAPAKALPLKPPETARQSCCPRRPSNQNGRQSRDARQGPPPPAPGRHAPARGAAPEAAPVAGPPQFYAALARRVAAPELSRAASPRPESPRSGSASPGLPLTWSFDGDPRDLETPPPLSAPLHSPPKLVKRARRASMTAATDSCESLIGAYPAPPEDPPHLPRTSSGFSFDVGLQLSFDEELVSLQLS